MVPFGYTDPQTCNLPLEPGRLQNFIGHPHLRPFLNVHRLLSLSPSLSWLMVIDPEDEGKSQYNTELINLIQTSDYKCVN